MLRIEYLNHTQKGYLEGKIELIQPNSLQIFLKQYQIPSFLFQARNITIFPLHVCQIIHYFQLL